MTNLSQLYEIYPEQPRATIPFGIRIGDTVFGTATGADPVTGEVPAEVPAQLEAAVASLRSLLSRGGMQSSNLERVILQTSGFDPGEVEAQLVEQGPIRDSAIIQGARLDGRLSPGYNVRIDVVASIGGSSDSVRLLRTASDGRVEGIKVGPVALFSLVTAADQRSGELPEEDTAVQVRAAFDNLQFAMERAGIGERQLLRVSGFHRDLGEKDLMNEEMVRRFPDPSLKPVHKYVPAALPSGVNFALQAIAVEGERRIVEMEGMKHNDPISLGALAGGVFVSSRVQAQLEPSARQQTARLIDSHARRLMELIGGSLTDVTQMVWGIGDAAYAAEVREEAAKYWPENAMPRLDILEADYPHSPLPRLEFLAVLNRQA